MGNKNLLFIHIPKTGGTTVNSFMAQSLPEGHCINFIDSQDYHAKPFFLTYRYYAGHVRLAQILPLIPREDFYIFTFIRDPAAQLLSHLAWAKNKTRDGAKPDPKEWDENYLQLFADVSALDMTSPDALGVFIQDSHNYRRLFDNQQTRFLLEDVREGPVDEGDVKIALHTLTAFDFVGVTARLQKGLGVIAAANGLKAPVKIGTENQNPWRAEHGLTRIAPAIRDALHDYTQYDQLIYKAAQDMAAKHGA